MTILGVLLGVLYVFLGICFSIAYNHFLKPVDKWDGSVEISFLFWPFFLLVMIILCIFGSLNCLYHWLFD